MAKIFRIWIKFRPRTLKHPFSLEIAYKYTQNDEFNSILSEILRTFLGLKKFKKKLMTNHLNSFAAIQNPDSLGVRLMVKEPFSHLSNIH